ncbi:MAG: hypothetical protein JNM41_15800 [Flavipsychrobacter sp.]|nr:hypothetical protein [Flavipsychrobacter sp.]
MGGSGSAPVVVSGMVVSNPSTGDYSITNGWFFYNGEMIRCESSSVSGATGGSDVYVSITETSAPLIYFDGSTPNVINEKTASLAVLPTGTVADATRFPLTDLNPYGKVFGAANRDAAWKTLSVSTSVVDGGVSGTVYYKKDHTTNTLHIRGVLTASNAQNFAASPGSLYYLMGSLPAAYAPVNTGYFVAQYFGAGLIKDDAGVGWVKQINCGLTNGGNLFANWIKPDLSVSAYGIVFNDILPLD